MRHDWKAYIEASALRELVWIYCPGHAGVRGNERADALASAAPVVGTLDMDKGDILRAINDCLLETDTVVEELSAQRLQEFESQAWDEQERTKERKD